MPRRADPRTAAPILLNQDRPFLAFYTRRGMRYYRQDGRIFDGAMQLIAHPGPDDVPPGDAPATDVDDGTITIGRSP